MPFLLMNGLNSGRRLSNLLWMLFFSYLKTINVSKKDKFGDAVRYALNQEKYLRVFLTDGDVPIDNNASERAIRGFCIGKKNWQMIDIINGAKTFATQGLLLSGSFSDQGRKSSSRDTQRLNTGGCKVAA